MKSFNILFIILLLSMPALSETIENKVNRIGKKLGIKIIYKKKIKDTWNENKYRLPINKKTIRHYLYILEEEFSKYPQGYFKEARAGKIILTMKLSFQKKRVAALPDPYGNRLFLSIDGIDGKKSKKFLRHVMHHELHHNTEYAIWRNQSYRWEEWVNLNDKNFKYNPEGSDKYPNKKYFYSLSNPIPGFINKLSTTAQEEDRSEIIAAMMNDRERKILHQLCKKDEILKEKIKKIIILLNKFMKIKDNKAYWEIKNQSCIE